jgi:hypothetical protein
MTGDATDRFPDGGESDGLEDGQHGGTVVCGLSGVNWWGRGTGGYEMS